MANATARPRQGQGKGQGHGMAIARPRPKPRPKQRQGQGRAKAKVWLPPCKQAQQRHGMHGQYLRELVLPHRLQHISLETSSSDLVTAASQQGARAPTAILMLRGRRTQKRWSEEECSTGSSNATLELVCVCVRGCTCVGSRRIASFAGAVLRNAEFHGSSPARRSRA